MKDKYNETSILPENVEAMEETAGILINRFSNLKNSVYKTITGIILTFMGHKLVLPDETDIEDITFHTRNKEKSGFYSESVYEEHTLNAVSLKPYKNSVHDGFSHIIMLEDENNDSYELSDTDFGVFEILDIVVNELKRMKAQE